MPAVRRAVGRRPDNVSSGDVNFMEVVFENMRDLGEPDVEIMRVNRILEENYFDNVDSFAATTPDIWDALALPRHVMEAVRMEMGLDNVSGNEEKATSNWQPEPAATDGKLEPALTTEEWERRRQEAAKRGEEKRRRSSGGEVKVAVQEEGGPRIDPGILESLSKFEVVPYTLRKMGDSHISWVAVLQEAVQRVTNRNTAPGVGLFQWEYESRMVGSGGERLEHRATVSFRLDPSEEESPPRMMKFMGCWHPMKKISQREAARNVIETLKLDVGDLIARHGGDPNANILQSAHIRLQRYFGQSLHKAGATVMEWKHVCSKEEEEESTEEPSEKKEESQSGGVRPEDEVGLWQSSVTVPQLGKEFISEWQNCKKDSQNDACFKLAAYLDSIGVPQANDTSRRKSSSGKGGGGGGGGGGTSGRKGGSQYASSPYARTSGKGRRYSGGEYQPMPNPVNQMPLGGQPMPSRVMAGYPSSKGERYMMRSVEYNYVPGCGGEGLRFEAPRPPPSGPNDFGSFGYTQQPQQQQLYPGMPYPAESYGYTVGSGMDGNRYSIGRYEGYNQQQQQRPVYGGPPGYHPQAAGQQYYPQGGTTFRPY